MTAASSVAAAAGIVALALAAYVTMSGALVLDIPGSFLSYRTQVFTVGLLLAAAWFLLTFARRRGDVGHAITGYVFLCIGLSIIWLIRSGSSI